MTKWRYLIVLTSILYLLALFDSACSASVKPCTDIPVYTGQSFNFVPFSVQEVHKALKTLDPRKPSGPDFIDPYFLQLAADFVAGPLAYLFNLTVENKEIPRIWKSAFVLPLLKGGDSAILNSYRRSEEHTSELQSHLNLVCR